jgi:hypothetical protein
MALAGSPHRVGEDVHLDGPQRAVGLRNGGRSDEGSIAHVGHVALLGDCDADVVSKFELEALPLA